MVRDRRGAGAGADHRVLALDCRGHGLSDKPHDPKAYGPKLADDVIALLDHLGIERAHVHGYSMGGWIVTELLDRHPDRIVTASYGGSGVAEVDPSGSRSCRPTARTPERKRATLPAAAEPRRDEQALQALRDYP